MAVRIIYYVHGTTTDNENGISTGWNPGVLSDLGITQSSELKTMIKDIKFDAVFCSDLQRAVDSCRIMFGQHQNIYLDSRLRECNYGDLNGGDSAVVEPMQLRKILERFPNGESYEDVKARVADFLKYLKNGFDGKTVALVSHKAPQLALEVLLNNKDWSRALNEDWRNFKLWQPGWEYLCK